MSETTTDQTQTLALTDPTDVQGDPATDLGDAGKRAIEAERRAHQAAERRAKAAEAERDALKAASMSDLEKAQKAAADASAELVALRQANLRQRVALAKGLPAQLADRLSGDTEDDMTADADALLALIGTPRIAPDYSQGAHGTPMPLTNEQMFLDFAKNF